VAVLISTEEDMRAFPSIEDALALSVAPHSPPGPLPPQPPRTPPRPCRHDARRDPWDPWPGALPAWPATSLPVIGWSPPTPVGPPPPPIVAWPWPQGPFIDLSGEDDDDNSQA
jgi:hypothetical protein